MAIRSGFFNSINGDRKYGAERFAEYFASFIGNGVFPNPGNGLQVMANNDMTVTVKAGRAWINGYILINDDDYTLTLDPADGVLSRIDRIVVRYDIADREIRLEVKKGAFASSPVAPALQRDTDAYELGLADIAVNAGAVSINQADITDLRMNANYCGIVKGLVDQIDTTDLFAQFEDSFLTWFDRMKDQLSSDAAGNLQQQIDDLGQALGTLGTHLADNTKHLVDGSQNLSILANEQKTYKAISYNERIVSTNLIGSGKFTTSAKRLISLRRGNLVLVSGMYDRDWGRAFSDVLVAASYGEVNVLQSAERGFVHPRTYMVDGESLMLAMGEGQYIVVAESIQHDMSILGG